MYNCVWESVHLRNALKRGWEDYPVPNGVSLNSTDSSNVLRVSCCLINSVGVLLVSTVNKVNLRDLRDRQDVGEGMLWMC